MLVSWKNDKKEEKEKMRETEKGRAVGKTN